MRCRGANRKDDVCGNVSRYVCGANRMSKMNIQMERIDDITNEEVMRKKGECGVARY